MAATKAAPAAMIRNTPRQDMNRTMKAADSRCEHRRRAV
jgi:hypothetical protein